jgi:hypothetical protein
VFNWGGRKRSDTAPSPDAPALPTETTAASKVLPKFLAALSSREAPVLLDLGPVVGTNVEFFGERLACRIHVLDLLTDVEAHSRGGGGEGLAEVLAARITLPYDSVDGLLCWDLFDFLDRPTGQSLARHLVKLLKPGGALYAFFGTTPIELRQYTRYVADGDQAFRLRTSPATPVTRLVLANRDIGRMFEPLAVTESVLLKSSTRETLFRKPTADG